VCLQLPVRAHQSRYRRLRGHSHTCVSGAPPPSATSLTGQGTFCGSCQR
jgi:hypothetical protein